MCGRFAQAKRDWPRYFEFSGSLHPPDMPVSYNIKPTQDVAMAYLCGGKLRAASARWWFVPQWHRGGVKDWKASSFNAKIETAHENPHFAPLGGKIAASFPPRAILSGPGQRATNSRIT